MKRAIRKTMEYPHPPSRVWAALTDAEALAAWLMPNDFAPRVGHRFSLRADPAPGFDGVVRCQVLELDPPTRMVWSWAGGNIDTVVRFELAAAGDGTRLTVEQTGFDGLGPVLTSLILQAGMAKLYGARLPAVLDRLRRNAPLAPPPSRPDRRSLGQGLEHLIARLAARFGPGKERK